MLRINVSWLLTFAVSPGAEAMHTGQHTQQHTIGNSGGHLSSKYCCNITFLYLTVAILTEID